MRNRILMAITAAVFVGSISACGSGGAANRPATNEYPAGDAAKGKTVFERGCNTCHLLTTEKLVGPGLAGLFEPGGPKLPDGVDYGGKLSNGRPITEANVAAWIKSGGQGKIGLMPANGNIADLTDQNIIDLIAYLKTLKK